MPFSAERAPHEGARYKEDKNTMTKRERIHRLVRGLPIDRVPFAQYSNIAAPNGEIWRTVGRRNMGLILWSRVHRIRYERSTIEEQRFEEDGRPGVRNVWHTPEGDLTRERLIEPAYGTSSARKHFVSDLADYPKLLALLRDTRVERDFAQYVKDQASLGDDGVAMAALCRTPWQQLWVQWVSIEDLSLHMADAPEVLEEVIAEISRIVREIIAVALDAAREIDVAYFNFGDNITAPIIGVDYFRRYAVPFYDELAGRLAEQGTPVPVGVHMDGDLKALWTLIAGSKVGMLDSFSPQPDNDTSVADAVRLWPEKSLGMNFPSSVHIRKPRAIYEIARALLDQGGRTGRLMIQVSENVPKDVWRASYPEIIRAIDDFGPL